MLVATISLRLYVLANGSNCLSSCSSDAHELCAYQLCWDFQLNAKLCQQG